MTTPSQSPSENPSPNAPAEPPPQAEVSGVVLAPVERSEAGEPEIYFEHFPRTSFSATQLSQRRKRMRRVVTVTLGGALLVLAAAVIRSALRGHETKAPAAAVEEPRGQGAASGAMDSEAQPTSDEVNAANGSPEGKSGAASQPQHHKTSLSHRPAKKASPGH
jgi:hypothetical protein